MDYQKFSDWLPTLYEGWETESVQPKSSQFQSALDQLKGETTAVVMQLLNYALDCMEPDEVYCEVGCFQGTTLVGAMLNHEDRVAYAVDNFSEFEFGNINLERLSANLIAFQLEDRVIFCDQSFQDFFADLQTLESSEKIGVYFYNSAHDYRSQLLGLLLAKPFFSEQALIVLSDCSGDFAQQAVLDFMTVYPSLRPCLDFSAAGFPWIQWHGIQVFSWDTKDSFDRTLPEFKSTRKSAAIAGIYDLHLQEQDSNQRASETTRKSLAAGNLSLAEKQYQEILSKDRENALAWGDLAIVYYLQEQYQVAIALILKSLRLDPNNAIFHYYLGAIAEKLGDLSQAAKAYQKAISLDPNLIDAYNNLGNILHEDGKLEQAESYYRKALEVNPEHCGSYINLGNISIAQEQIDRAIEIYQTALKLAPDPADLNENLEFAKTLKANPLQAHQYFGNNAFQWENYTNAIEHYENLLGTELFDASLYINLGCCYKKLAQYDKSIAIWKAGIKQYPNIKNFYEFLIVDLHSSGQTQAAIAAATDASHCLSNDFSLKLKQHLLLPLLYEDEQEIALYRQRFSQELTTLIQQVSLDSEPEKTAAMEAIRSHVNFSLAYQDENDLALQQQYGQFVYQIMAANYPDWVQPLPMPSLATTEKIRIGYVSGCLWGHTVGKLTLGWLQHCDRNRFEIYCYQILEFQDEVTQKFRECSDYFYQIPHDLDAVCQQIRADELHVLVFLDIGMHAPMLLLAGLRLAPVQCSTWAHPVTSGLPTVDYFLSSDLMEPENAQDHYSETLVRLPNLGIAYPTPQIPAVTQSRADFADLQLKTTLRQDAVVYLCCQLLCKYLPQYDWIFTAIAKQVPQAQFVFIARPNAYIAEQFRQRLRRSFAAAGLNCDDHCIILAQQNQVAYWNLNLLSDIFLDTFSWSGGHTTLEAIACHLPAVTRPSRFMRGRHSYAILRRLDVTETIAKDENDYVAIAVRLATDRPWRDAIIQRMVQNLPAVYNDKTCVTALETFYQQVVHARLHPATE